MILHEGTFSVVRENFTDEVPTEKIYVNSDDFGLFVMIFRKRFHVQKHPFNECILLAEIQTVGNNLAVTLVAKMAKTYSGKVLTN